MIKVNEDPHAEGYELGPTYRLTAIFESCNAMVEILETLEHAGFAEKDIEVFADPEGAKKLDFAGKRHGFLARLKRRIEMIYADETDYLRKMEKTLQQGGMAVFVFTSGDEAAKQRALEVLKPYHPSEVVYWGNFAIERLWMTESQAPVSPNAIMPSQKG